MRQWVRDGRMGAGGGGVEERLDKFGKDGVSAGNGNARVSCSFIVSNTVG